MGFIQENFVIHRLLTEYNEFSIFKGIQKVE